MHPNVISQHYDVQLHGEAVAATSIQGLFGYEEASRGGRFHVAAVAIRHRVKYEWATRPAGCTDAEIYRKCEFLAMDEKPVCLPTAVLHSCELLRNLISRRFDHPEVQAAVLGALRRFAGEALRDGWGSAMVEVEVETATLLSYDGVRWWCPVPPCALPAAGEAHPIEALEMEVYAEEEGAGAAADGCAVCLEDFVAGAQVERLPCGHRFHGECVLPWLDMHGSCPLCRSEFCIK